jgi:hypothetical protein
MIDYVGDDIAFTLTDFQPHERLKDIRTHTKEQASIQKAESLAFYFQGVKLQPDTPLRAVLKKF